MLSFCTSLQQQLFFLLGVLHLFVWSICSIAWVYGLSFSSTVVLVNVFVQASVGLRFSWTFWSPGHCAFGFPNRSPINWRKWQQKPSYSFIQWSIWVLTHAGSCCCSLPFGQSWLTSTFFWTVACSHSKRQRTTCQSLCTSEPGKKAEAVNKQPRGVVTGANETMTKTTLFLQTFKKPANCGRLVTRALDHPRRSGSLVRASFDWGLHLRGAQSLRTWASHLRIWARSGGCFRIFSFFSDVFFFWCFFDFCWFSGPFWVSGEFFSSCLALRRKAFLVCYSADWLGKSFGFQWFE